MKKIKLSVAALLIAGMSYGQTSVDSVTISKYEVYEMIVVLEDILEWQQQDMDNGDTNMGKHSEEWGSNYWLTEMAIRLHELVNTKAYSKFAK